MCDITFRAFEHQNSHSQYDISDSDTAPNQLVRLGDTGATDKFIAAKNHREHNSFNSVKWTGPTKAVLFLSTTNLIEFYNFQAY